MGRVSSQEKMNIQDINYGIQEEIKIEMEWV